MSFSSLPVILNAAGYGAIYGRSVGSEKDSNPFANMFNLFALYELANTIKESPFFVGTQLQGWGSHWASARKIALLIPAAFIDPFSEIVNKGAQLASIGMFIHAIAMVYFKKSLPHLAFLTTFALSMAHTQKLLPEKTQEPYKRFCRLLLPASLISKGSPVSVACGLFSSILIIKSWCKPGN